MQTAATASWNQLLPEQPPFTATVCPDVALVGSKSRHNRVKGETGGKDVLATAPLSDWEMEAVRRYRTLQTTQDNIYSQCDYVSSTATSGALLQLIVRSKLLPIADWRDCARVVAGWFQGPKPLPLNLLSHAISRLVTTHQLTPCSAARWVLDISKVLLGESCGPFSFDDWAVAEELGRSVYGLQATGHALFENFSSMLLDVMLSDLLDGEETPQSWGLLSFCFLLRRNTNFVLSAWENDKQKHSLRMQRACDTKHEIPTHIMAILAAVV